MIRGRARDIARDGVLDIQDALEKIVTGDMIPDGRGKPKPDTYLRACPVNLLPYRCVAFEDAGPGVASAYSACMPCIAVPSEFTCRHDFSNATYVVNGLARSARILPGYGRKTIDVI